VRKKEKRAFWRRRVWPEIGASIKPKNVRDYHSDKASKNAKEQYSREVRSEKVRKKKGACVGAPTSILRRKKQKSHYADFWAKIR